MFQYPYGDTQQLNLDWLMEQWQETKASIDGSLQGEIDRVEAAITDLLTARDQAVAARTAAEAAATSAAGYAGTASTAASTATAQAAAAAASAALAGNHASNAQTSETNAGLQATAAGNSASAAAVSATNARNSELAAAASSSAAAGNALYAEGFAVGEQNGTPVSSGSPYYENNAKYYAEQAEAYGLPSLPQNTINDVNVASFPDGADNLTVKELITIIEPAQSGSGTPAPDNVRSMIGYTEMNIYRDGKNLVPNDFTERSSQGLSVVPNPDGTIHIFGVSEATSSALLWRKSFNDGEFILKAGTYRISRRPYTNTDIFFQIVPYSGTTAYSRNTDMQTTYSNDISIHYIDIGIIASAGNIIDTTISPMLALNSDPILTPNPYEPYKGIVKTLDFTNYGGTIYGAYIDIVNNLIRITHGHIASYAGETINEPWLSSIDEYTPGTTPSTGAEVVYPLSSPIEYTFSPDIDITTIYGINNIWADAGKIEKLSYYSNASLLNQLTQLLIAPILTEMKADTALSVNDFRIVNNTLYKVTASIAAGATLNPGTNVEATTVGTQLKTLLT